MLRIVAIIFSILTLSWGGAGVAFGGIYQDFDLPGSSYVLDNHFGGAPAQVLSGGPSGNFLRLNYATKSGNQNFIFFTEYSTGPAQRIIADFDFRMYAGSRADGLGFALLNTAQYGQTPGTGDRWSPAEEPNRTGSLGIGFDIFDNSEGGNNHLSLHYNNSRLANFHIAAMQLWTSTENPPFNHAHIEVDLAAGTVSVVLTPPGMSPIQVLNNYAVPGLAPYEFRVAFGARTGGCTANHDLDNIRVSAAAVVVPLPGSVLLLGSGLLGLFCWRRRF